MKDFCIDEVTTAPGLCSFTAAAALFAGEAAVIGSGVAATTGALATAGVAASTFIPATAGLFGAGGVIGSGGFVSGLLSNAFTNLGPRDFLSGGFSLFSGSQSIEAGRLAAAGLRDQALFADLASRQELLKGRKEALDLEALTLDEIEEFTAGVGARGITGSGSARIARTEAIAQSNRQQDFATENAILRSAAESIRARSLRLDAKAEEATGVLGAFKTGAEFALSRTRRG